MRRDLEHHPLHEPGFLLALGRSSARGPIATVFRASGMGEGRPTLRLPKLREPKFVPILLARVGQAQHASREALIGNGLAQNNRTQLATRNQDQSAIWPLHQTEQV